MKRKIVSFVLIVLILFPLVPSPVKAQGFVREIDVLMNNFKLLVDGEGFSHKEVFLHDGDLYVPMKDLGKALGLGVNFDMNKRTLSINSNGKLKFDDNSKYPIAYQRGYEIDVKMRLIDSINNDIRDFLYGAKEKSVSKDIDLKTIKVGFSNTKIILDGKAIELDVEPILYDNEMYLALASLSPYLYITPKLNNNVVNIDTIFSSYYSIDELVRFREDLNNRYARELEELNKKKKIIMDVKIPYEEVKTLRDMEWYLNKHLGRINELPIDIDLSSATDNLYYVDISFSRNQDYRWRNLSRRDVEAHIWDIFVAISSLYDEDAKIQGAIRNPGYSSSSSSDRRNYVTFEQVYGNIQFNFYYSNLQDKSGKLDPIYIEKLLSENLSSFNRIKFNYDARISGFDLELSIDPLSRGVKDWDPSMLHSYLYEINLLISRDYPELKTYGKIIVDEDYIIDFSLIDGLISSNALNRTIEEDLNSSYNRFVHGGIRAEIKYSLVNLGESQYKLMASIDYDTINNPWTNENLETLNSYIHSAASYVLSLIDGDLFVQIYDKNQVLLNEYSIYRNTVAMVIANPPSGDVVEGTKVSLSTDTVGATIYYTLDGSTPSKNSLIYNKPIEVYGNMTIKAFASKIGLKESNIATFIYNTKENPNMASRLNELSVENATLNPLFDKNSFNQDFKLSIPHGMSRVTIRAIADGGTVLINNEETINGKVTLDIDVGTSMIKIIHRESGKTDRVYTVVVTRGEQDYPDLQVNINEFSAEIVGVFKGELSGGGDSDYRDYRVVLMLRDKSNTVVKSISVNPNGSFEDTFPVDIVHKIIKYKYMVYKGVNVIIEPTEIEFTK